MLEKKKEFIEHYLKTLVHKSEQELSEKLPEEGFVAELITRANEIIKEIVKV